MSRLLKVKGFTACSCCRIRHDSRFCSQCIAAGCNHRGAKESCRQSESVQALAKVPEWRLREDLAALKLEHANLVAEAQRLTRIIYGIDPKLLDTPDKSIADGLADALSMTRRPPSGMKLENIRP